MTIQLPTAKSKKVLDIKKQITLLYGRPKVGKSTICSEFTGSVFCATEPGLNHLECFKTDVKSWVDFLYFCKALQDGGHEFQNVIIDTVDNLVKFCTDFICEKNGIEHPGDLPMGKGWRLVTDELHEKLHKLAMSGFGIVMISHSKVTEIQTRKEKYNYVDISLSGGNKKIIEDLADHILLVDSELRGDNEVRFIRTQASKFWNAGSRNDKLQAAAEIPLDYKELAKYFTNDSV